MPRRREDRAYPAFENRRSHVLEVGSTNLVSIYGEVTSLSICRRFNRRTENDARPSSYSPLATPKPLSWSSSTASCCSKLSLDKLRRWSIKIADSNGMSAKILAVENSRRSMAGKTLFVPSNRVHTSEIVVSSVNRTRLTDCSYARIASSYSISLCYELFGVNSSTTSILRFGRCGRSSVCLFSISDAEPHLAGQLNFSFSEVYCRSFAAPSSFCNLTMSCWTLVMICLIQAGDLERPDWICDSKGRRVKT